VASESYLIAWSWYLGATLVLIAVWWYWTRKLPTLWRNVLRALPAAWALMPLTVALDHERLAPAWLVMVFEGFLRDEGDLRRGGLTLLLATVLALLMVAANWWLDKRRASAQQDTPPMS
jgi:hypothetical protein